MRAPRWPFFARLLGREGGSGSNRQPLLCYGTTPLPWPVFDNPRPRAGGQDTQAEALQIGVEYDERFVGWTDRINSTLRQL
jgi:hypothetical protein